MISRGFTYIYICFARKHSHLLLNKFENKKDTILQIIAALKNIADQEKANLDYLSIINAF